MTRGIKKTHEQNLQEMEQRREWLKRQKPLKSPCLKGRRRHQFREPKTRSLTPDLKCKWCGKTVEQVRKEQKPPLEIAKAKNLGYYPEHGRSYWLVKCECGETTELYCWSGSKKCPNCGKLLHLWMSFKGAS